MFDILANRIGFTKKIPCLAEEINNKRRGKVKMSLTICVLFTHLNLTLSKFFIKCTL